MKLSAVVASENALHNAFAVLRGIEPSMKILNKLGYDGIELALKDPSEITRQELGSLLKKNSLEVSAISTGQVFAARNLMFTEEDKEKRKQLYDSFVSFINLASDFGQFVNVGRVRGFVGNRDKAFCAQLFMDLMCPIADYAESQGVKILLEPVNRYEIDFINSVDEGAALMKQVGKKNLMLMPDVFHMNIEDAKIGEALIRNKDYVGYVHLADSNRLSCGDGHLDFDEVFDALKTIKYDGWCAMECFPKPDPETAAKRSIDYIRSRYF